MKSKKSLIALAVLGTLASVASAQSTVTVYGSIDTGIRHVTNSTLGKDKLSLDSGISNPNRLGFRGAEDLGGGTNAHFNLEMGYSADTGAMFDTASLFNRNAFVGIGGAWGSVDVGRQTSVNIKTMAQYDPLKAQYTGIAPFATFTPGSAAVGCVPLVGVGIVAFPGGACARYNNDIQYTGVFGGLTLRAEYMMGEQPGGASNGSAKAAGFNYVMGALSVGGSYTAETAVGTAASAISQAVPAGALKKTWTAGAAYTFGQFRATVGYSDNTNGTSTTDTVIKNAWTGLSYQATPALSLTGAYYQTKTEQAVINGQKLDFFMFEAKYSLSKRTALYAEFDQAKWSHGANFVTPIVGAATPGRTQNAYSVGINHTF